MAKIKSVVIMGGIHAVETNSSDNAANPKRKSSRTGRASFTDILMTAARVETSDMFTPDDSEVNRLDSAAARFFYSQCQRLGVQLIIVPHEVNSTDDWSLQSNPDTSCACFHLRQRSMFRFLARFTIRLPVVPRCLAIVFARHVSMQRLDISVCLPIVMFVTGETGGDAIPLATSLRI